jgi:pilus assembly protein CpaB
MLLMQNVVLLATGRQVRPAISDSGQPGANRTYSTVTLEATPHDAQRLILAQKAGSLTAVLRGPADKTPLLSTTMDARDLFGMRPATRTAALEAPRAEMIIGGMGSGRAARDLISIAPFLTAPAPASPATAQPTAAVDPAIANAVQQLSQAAAPAPMELR